MPEPKLARLELQIMDVLWTQGQASIREIQEAFPERKRPAYTTIQTTVYRLEEKKALRRVKKVGNFHIFEPAISRDAARGRLIDDLLALFGGRTQPVMAHLIESGKLTLEDVKDAPSRAASALRRAPTDRQSACRAPRSARWRVRENMKIANLLTRRRAFFSSSRYTVVWMVV